MVGQALADRPITPIRVLIMRAMEIEPMTNPCLPATKLATKDRPKVAREPARSPVNLPFSAAPSRGRSHDKNQFVGPFPTAAGDRPKGLPKRRRSQSRTITAAQAINVRDAALHAERIGLPLNRHCTLDWELAGVVDPVHATGEFCTLARDMLRRYGGIAYVWVQENGSVVGRHVHILLHVPRAANKAFSHAPRRWVRMCGGKAVRGVLKTLPVTGHTSLRNDDCLPHERYRINLRIVVEYILKAADHEARLAVGLRRPTQASVVTGKRTSTSQNIGRKARETFRSTEDQKNSR